MAGHRNGDDVITQRRLAPAVALPRKGSPVRASSDEAYGDKPLTLIRLACTEP
jgi:hypothetical protein